MSLTPWLLLLGGCLFVTDADLATRLDADADGVPRPSDCDDDDPDVTTHSWFADSDGDGWGTSSETRACTRPEGFSDKGGDCDDSRPAVHPDAVETCNGLDDDCDGVVDPGTAADAVHWYLDGDGDGFGDPATQTPACSAPSGAHLRDATDCDDTDPDVHPGAADAWYDGIDADCGGQSDYDADGDGFDAESHGGADCDDGAGGVHPDAVEACGDHIDNDCDGATLACALEGVVSAADATATLLGPQEQGAVGRALAGVGDVDGDGRDELLVGGDGVNAGGGGGGAAFLVSGPVSGTIGIEEAAVATLVSSQGSSALGGSVAAAGDHDGDGYADVLVGARYGSSEPGDSTGRAYLVHGPLSGEVRVDEQIVLDSGGEGRGLGGVVAGGADLDGDGRPDVAAHSGHATADQQGEGVVFIWTGPLSGVTTTQEATATWRGDQPGASLGSRLHLGPDLTGDGLGDAVAGVSAGAAGYPAGGAYILPGGLEGERLATDGVFIAGDGGSNGSQPGGVADLDGDGHADLILGVTESSVEQAFGVAIIPGPITSDTSTSSAVARIWASDVRIGGAGAVAGDTNGSGTPDLLVPVMDCAACAVFDASVALYLGPFEGTVDANDYQVLLWADERGDQFGAAVDGAGDIDGDGAADLLVGAHGDASAGAFTGAAHLFLTGSVAD